MVRDSATTTIKDYLEKACQRLELEDLEHSDMKKAFKHVEKAKDELEKEME